MKVVIELILIEIDLYLIKLIKALHILKLALWLPDHLLLLVGIVVGTSGNLIYEVLDASKRGLRLIDLAIDMLLQDVVCLGGTIFFE